MYLDVTFKDGTVTHIGISNSHEVRIVGPDQKVQDAFSFDGVASVGINFDGAPEATNPNPAPNVGAAEGPTETIEQPETVEQPQVEPQIEPQIEPQTEQPAEVDPGADITDAEAHDQAVAAAAAAVEQTPTVDDPAAHIAAAQADVEAALAQWPDSAPLQDAKAQLEQIAGDLAAK